MSLPNLRASCCLGWDESAPLQPNSRSLVDARLRAEGDSSSRKTDPRMLAAAAVPVRMGGMVSVSTWGCARVVPWFGGCIDRSKPVVSENFTAPSLRASGRLCLFLDRIEGGGATRVNQCSCVHPPASRIDTRSKRCKKESRVSKTGMCHLCGRVGRPEGPNALFWMRGPYQQRHVNSPAGEGRPISTQ